VWSGEYEMVGVVNWSGIVFNYFAEDQLAWLYNDESVLENHHISLAFQLLKDDGCNVFAKLTPKQWKTVRKMAIDMVCIAIKSQ